MYSFQQVEEIEYIGDIRHDIQGIVAKYLKNNVNRKALDQQREAMNELEEVSDFSDDDLVLSSECLLDTRTGKQHFVDFMEQKTREPEILSEILNKIKTFVESKKFPQAVEEVKKRYNFKTDAEATKKIRQIMLRSLK